MTEPLSPAAAAVLHAYETSYTESGLVDALRAAADQVVPFTPFDRRYTTRERWDARDDIRSDLLAIAAELEAQP